jgi:hypothetical protein
MGLRFGGGRAGPRDGLRTRELRDGAGRGELPVEQALEVAEVLFLQDHEFGQHRQVEGDLPALRAAMLSSRLLRNRLSCLGFPRSPPPSTSATLAAPFRSRTRSGGTSPRTAPATPTLNATCMLPASRRRVSSRTLANCSVLRRSSTSRRLT